MFKLTDPILGSAFLTDVIIFKYLSNLWVSWFILLANHQITQKIHKLNTHGTVVLADIFWKNSLSFVDQVDRRRRGFKYVGHNFELLRFWLPVVTEVTLVSKSLRLLSYLVASQNYIWQIILHAELWLVTIIRWR